MLCIVYRTAGQLLTSTVSCSDCCVPGRGAIATTTICSENVVVAAVETLLPETGKFVPVAAEHFNA
jgi:hypothetical protein